MSEQEMNEQEFYRWLGKRIRDLREKAGMKKKDLADKLKINATFLSNVENKGQKISVFQLNRLLKALGYTQADLMDEEGIENTSMNANFEQSRFSTLCTVGY
jgi:transcriptional regulator with XRE-family HTH domain